MKRAQRLKNWILTGSLALVSFAFITSCDKDDNDDVDNRDYIISGNANGTQVVPSVSGTGTGTFNGTYSPTSRMLTYTSNWTGLTGAPTSAGFYNGASGMSGASTGDNWTLGAGSTETGTYSSSVVLTPDQATQLTSGNLYYSYGTTTNPDGEVRGQITATR